MGAMEGKRDLGGLMDNCRTSNDGKMDLYCMLFGFYYGILWRLFGSG